MSEINFYPRVKIISESQNSFAKHTEVKKSGSIVLRLLSKTVMQNHPQKKNIESPSSLNIVSLQ
jgi:hypothetical protein